MTDIAPSTAHPPDADTLAQAFARWNAAPVHRTRFLRAWLHNTDLKAGRARPEDHFPKHMRAEAPALLAALRGLVHTVSEHPAEDGARRALLGLTDGQAVETVLLPREGVCVSTQIGCAVGCRFCMTGRDGLLRQLRSTEIVAQVVWARARAPLRKVVFMGMGEPAHNLDQVIQAIQWLGQEGGFAHKQLVFSTVGDLRAFTALRQHRVQPALALSLHTSRADLRETLLPKAPRLSPEALVEAADAYAVATGYPVQYQWTLLDGINDTEEELEGIERLLKGRRGMLNLIPFNQVDGSEYRRPPGEHAAAMARHLNRRGIYTRLRQSAGQAVEGGCGQLRARVQASRADRHIPIMLHPEDTPASAPAAGARSQTAAN